MKRSQRKKKGKKSGKETRRGREENVLGNERKGRKSSGAMLLMLVWAGRMLQLLTLVVTTIAAIGTTRHGLSLKVRLLKKRQRLLLMLLLISRKSVPILATSIDVGMRRGQLSQRRLRSLLLLLTMLGRVDVHPESHSDNTNFTASTATQLFNNTDNWDDGSRLPA